MRKILSILFFALIFFSFFTANAFAQNESEPELLGQIIELNFKIPGIGSESGNLNPLTPTRNVTFYFYEPDANSSDPSIKPLVAFKTHAIYDSDPVSPLFGSFVNRQIDLGSEVPDGKYQVSFATDKSLPYLITNKENDIGGKIFEIKRTRSKPIPISDKTLITGDIFPYPGGDGTMDEKDHMMLINCFGAKAVGEDCPNETAADLNDDGAVDGTDHNLMFNSFRVLLQQGLPVPSIFALPSKSASGSPTREPSPNPTKAPVKKQSSAKSSNSTTILLSVIVIVILAVLVFLILKRKRVIGFIDVLHRKNASKPQESQEEPSAQPADEPVDKEFFVKKQAEDPDNKRIVLTLTDDNGPTLGYYSGEEVKDGFANIKGMLKHQGNKVFIEVSQITPEQESSS